MKAFIDQLNDVSPGAGMYSVQSRANSELETNDALESMSRHGIGILRYLAIVAAAEASDNLAGQGETRDTENLSDLKSFWREVTNVFAKLFRERC